MANASIKQTTKPTPKSPPMIKLSQDKPSKLRGVIAFLLAGLAIFFASLAIITYWTERTITDTENFSAVVGPLAKNPEIQQLVSQKISEVVIEKAGQTDLAELLLGSVPPNVNTPEVKQQITTRVQAEVNKVIASEAFYKLWANTTSNLHAQFIKVLSEPKDSDVIVISYESYLKDALALLKNTPLNKLSEADLQKGSGQVKIQSDDIKDLRQKYQEATKIDTTALVIALVLGGLAILCANYRLKMVRKLALGLAVTSSLIIIFGLVSTNVAIGGLQNVELKAGQTVVASLISELIRLSAIIAGVSIALVALSSWLIHRPPKALKQLQK